TKNINLNIFDVFLILIQSRAAFIGPDIKIEVECPDTKRKFEYTIRIDEITSKFKNIQVSKQFRFAGITYNFSTIKLHDFLDVIRNEDKLEYYEVLLISSLDSVYNGDKLV